MNTNNHAPQEEVDTLKRMVSRHLSEPFHFICVTESDLPGWWGKVRLFSMSRNRNLWLDLDVVITGSLDGLVTPTDKLRICKNWAQSGWGGCQSSVMYWENDFSVISDTFPPEIAYWPPRNEPGVLWGDQEWITKLRDEGVVDVEHFSPDDVKSYKYHCQNGLPQNTKVAVFHGKPKPSEVMDDWVIKYRC